MRRYKAACNCKGGMSNATGLYWSGTTKLGDILWVCSECRRPSIGVYEAFIDTCEDCLGDYSSPWMQICKRCFRYRKRSGQLSDEHEVYRGWRWASGQPARWPEYCSSTAVEAKESLQETLSR